MRPKRPMAEAKISTTRIFTKRELSWASASAALLPLMPTATPQNKLDAPTVRPAQNKLKPAHREREGEREGKGNGEGDGNGREEKEKRREEDTGDGNGCKQGLVVSDCTERTSPAHSIRHTVPVK